jgi:hypothetical protein
MINASTSPGTANAPAHHSSRVTFATVTALTPRATAPPRLCLTVARATGSRNELADRSSLPAR